MNEQFKSIETTELVKIANAIRSKTGSNEQIALEDMPDKIRSIEGGGIYLPELEFEGSSTDLLAGKQLIDSEGNIVTGAIPTTTQTTPTISVNSAGKITATASQSTGYVEAGTKTATHQLDVQAAQTIIPSTSDKTIAAGKYLTGTQTIKGDANLKAENIAEGVSIFGVAGTHAGDSGGVVLPDLTNEGAASDLLSGKQLIDSDGNIVEGTIATKSASNLTANGATVTVPAGYYASQATKSVATTTQATPSVSVDSTGKITATATQTEGYVSAGTKSSTHQLAFQAAKTITPTTASQIAVSSGYYTGGNITVAAIPNTYIKPSYTKSATTYTPTTTNQTISAGTYCSGVQTIKGDSNLVAGNIKSGVNIFGVSGTYAGSGDTSVEDAIINRSISGTYINNRVTTIGSCAFYHCTKLSSVQFANVTNIGSSAFFRCMGLISADFPLVTQADSVAFGTCTKLRSINIPELRYLNQGVFIYCSSLSTVSLPNVSGIGSSAFYQCYNLKSPYLTSSKVCTLFHSSAFKSTPIAGYSTSAGTYGRIYVPASLLASYRKATNWTYFSSRFVGI